ncbi:MAG: hypothetical protein IKT09_01705 [Synergistes sp.]|nr:hypothetical protein [Synergistes sp.]
MLFKITTGFFVWDVLKWLLLFAVTSSIFLSAVRYAVRRGGIKRPENRNSIGDDSAGAFSSDSARCFLEVCVKPWTDHPLCPLFGMGALLLFFVTAIFLG